MSYTEGVWGSNFLGLGIRKGMGEAGKGGGGEEGVSVLGGGLREEMR